MKKTGNKIYVMTAMLLLLLSVSGCIFDNAPEEPQTGTIILSLKGDAMNTRAAVPFPATGEDQIIRARVIVFAGSVVEHNRSYTSADTEFENPIRITVATGSKLIYVVANETTTLGTSLSSVATPAELEGLMAENITAGLVPPIVMIGKETASITTTGVIEKSVMLTRTAAKINIKLQKDCLEDVTISKISLLSNAGKTPVWEGGATVASQTYWNHATNLSTPQTLTATLWDALTLYVYENLGNSFSSKANATQLELEGTFDGTFTTYRVYVNEEVPSPGSISGSDPSSSTVGTPPAAHYYNIKRNHEYRLTGTITRIGEYSSLYIDAKIRPWTTHEYQVPLQ